MPDAGAGYEDLLAILENNASMTQADAARPPGACPYDLQTLEAASTESGESLHCAFCGRTYNPGSPPERGWR